MQTCWQRTFLNPALSHHSFKFQLFRHSLSNSYIALTPPLPPYDPQLDHHPPASHTFTSWNHSSIPPYFRTTIPAVRPSQYPLKQPDFPSSSRHQVSGVIGIWGLNCNGDLGYHALGVDEDDDMGLRGTIWMRIWRWWSHFLARHSFLSASTEVRLRRVPKSSGHGIGGWGVLLWRGGLDHVSQEIPVPPCVYTNPRCRSSLPERLKAVWFPVEFLPINFWSRWCSGTEIELQWRFGLLYVEVDKDDEGKLEAWYGWEFGRELWELRVFWIGEEVWIMV